MYKQLSVCQSWFTIYTLTPPPLYLFQRLLRYSDIDDDNKQYKPTFVQTDDERKLNTTNSNIILISLGAANHFIGH